MKITRVKLLKLKACEGGLIWYDRKKEKDLVKICALLLKEDRCAWANWLLVRLMTKKQKAQYAVFAAEKVIDIFEKKYPDDKRPREAIEAAKKYIKSPTVANKNAAYAAYVAYAADTTYAAYVAAFATYAADATFAADAIYAAYVATFATFAADATYAAYVAANAAANAHKKLQAKIVNYGLNLVGGI